MIRHRFIGITALIVPVIAVVACTSLSSPQAIPTPIPYGTQDGATLIPPTATAPDTVTGSAPMLHEEPQATSTFSPLPTSASGRPVIGPEGVTNLGIAGYPVFVQGEGVQSLSWSSDSKLLVVGTATGIQIMDPITGERWMTRMEPAAALNVRFSPDGSLLGMVHPEPVLAVHFWNVTSDTVLGEWHERMGNPISFGWSPDPDVFATGYPDGSLVVWSFSANDRLHTLNAAEVIEGGQVTGVEFSPDGKTVAGIVHHSDESPHVVLWSVESGEMLDSYDPEDYLDRVGPDVYPVLAPDWRYLAWVAGSEVVLIDLNTGRQVFRLAHESKIQGITISAGSRLLATSSMKSLGGSPAPAVTIWDLSTGRHITDIFSFPVVPPALAFSPDGTLLAIAGGEDVQVWGDQSAGPGHGTSHSNQQP